MCRRSPSYWLGALLAGAVFLGGCSSFSPEEPPVADSTFVRVLTEFHLVAAREQINQDSSLVGVRDSILKTYGVTQAELEAAMDYYDERPAAYELLYGAVLDSLNAYQSELRRPPGSQ